MTPRGETPFHFHVLTEPSRMVSSKPHVSEYAADASFKSPYGSQFENITPTSQTLKLEVRPLNKNTSLQSELTDHAVAECSGIVPETPWNELVHDVCESTQINSSLTSEMSGIRMLQVPPSSLADDSSEFRRNVAVEERRNRVQNTYEKLYVSEIPNIDPSLFSSPRPVTSTSQADNVLSIVTSDEEVDYGITKTRGGSFDHSHDGPSRKPRSW